MRFEGLHHITMVTGDAQRSVEFYAGARAYGMFDPVEERLLSEALGFTRLGGGEHRVDGEERHFHWAYDRPAAMGEPGAGTVHHIAWAGFAVDGDPERLGEELRVPKVHAHLRERLEETLTPVVNPRAARRERVGAR